MNFDEIINLLDPTEREVINQVIAKQPELKRGWQRQEDYSRKLDEFRAKATEFQEIANYAQSWDLWAENNWDPENKSTKAEAALRQRVQELETAVAGKSENEVTFDDINKYITDQGLAKRSEIEGLLQQKENAFTQSLQGSAWVGAKLAQIGTRHMLEFKQEFNGPDFLAKVNEYGMNDLDKAYDNYVASERSKVNEAKLAEKLKEVEKEAFEKGRKDAIEGVISQSGGQITPTSDSTNDIGHFQRKLQNMNSEDVVPDGRNVAQYAAQKWREDNLRSANA